MTEKKIEKFDDESFGVIPFRLNKGEIFWLLVLHYEGHWTFPRGHKDEGEEDIDTAKRELYEETGVQDVKIIPTVKLEENFSFEKGGFVYQKQVIYFLGEVDSVGSNTLPQFKKEIPATKWFPTEKAIEQLTFLGTKKLLLEAMEVIARFK